MILLLAVNSVNNHYCSIFREHKAHLALQVLLVYLALRDNLVILDDLEVLDLPDSLELQVWKVKRVTKVAKDLLVLSDNRDLKVHLEIEDCLDSLVPSVPSVLADCVVHLYDSAATISVLD